ncbi:hypothetical protein MTR_4g014760 [Medicago truncatula]|uniref:Uncharacterized protein n=1 Tax=Medicago truncatula TaxID=3880 RepID=G7JLU7_MEDTR|nr:hypothetical protein MTR_4g014760 [Medicago truncatula]
MCLAHVNDNHFMMVYLTDDCPIPPTSVLWKQHRQEDAKSWDERYVDRMIAYNELSRAESFVLIGDDDLYHVENLDPKENFATHKKVGYGVKIEMMKALDLMIVAYTSGWIS